MQPADFRLETRGVRARVALLGDWTAACLGRTGDRLARELARFEVEGVDSNKLGRFDTAGAFALLQAAGGRLPAGTLQERPQAAHVLRLVAGVDVHGPRRERELDPVQRFLVRLGQGTLHVGEEFYNLLQFYGHLLAAAGRTLADPRRIRWAAWVSLAERAGLDALPIVALTSFFIGAVVAFLSADLLLEFGASVFAVDLVGYAVLREFAIVITAVLLAGRSASSFAAEIGAMKMNQEVDAMKVLGIDPFDALVLPRVAALLVMTPLLAFTADITGLIGGALVCWAKLGLSPTFFLQRILGEVGATHFWVGESKAPVFAAVIAAIGCRHGLAVGGDVETLGRRVTSAVVQAIFAIICLDAIFAMIYMEANILSGGPTDEPAIEVRGLVNAFEGRIVHDEVNLTVRRGEVLGLVGGSGAGKTVLLNTIIGLQQPVSGEVRVLGQDVLRMTAREHRELERRWGVLFQSGALFTALDVEDNVAAPLIEHTSLSSAWAARIAELKIAMVGLPPEARSLKPAELSGGMRKRAGLARALVLDPDLLFLDEPTAGLDPIGAAAFDTLIRELATNLGLTVLMVTHDLDSLYAVCDRVAVLADHKVVATDVLAELEKSAHPWIREYFLGPRGRAAAQGAR